jgi:hypothetical protein
MNRIYTAIAVSGLLLLGAQAMADDTNTSTSSMTAAQKHQAMKDCVARETSNNSSMSKTDARKACKSQMKAQADQSNNGGKYDNQNEANDPTVQRNSSSSGMSNTQSTP